MPPIAMNRPFKHTPGKGFPPIPPVVPTPGQDFPKPTFVEASDQYREGWPPPGKEGVNRRWETLQPGATIDRFGGEHGSWLSPTGTPYPDRAITEDSYEKGYFVYEVARPFNTMTSTITEAQGYPGGGIQHDIRPLKVSDLLNADPPYLRRVQVTK